MYKKIIHITPYVYVYMELRKIRNLRPRRDSNSDFKLRRLASYPLDDEDK